jgi:hypothetical protein
MKKYCFILLTGILLSSCSRDPLDKTIFIQDEDDPNLPAYTEWGYNSFGAEYERDYFLSSNFIVPCKILYNNGLLHFSLSGNNRNKNDMTLLFIFPSPQIVDYKDLVQLNDVEIDLSADNCAVKILQNDNETILDVIEGKLHFKRSQLLSVDDVVNRVILSGFFDLRFLQNIFPLSISNGRFDLGITQHVFYLN